jgi:hypothetical protein
VVVVSEENGQISLVERARIVRNLTEAGLARAIQGLLDPAGGRRGAFGWRSATRRPALEGRSPRLRDLGRFVGRPAGSNETSAAAVPMASTAGKPVTARDPAPPSAPDDDAVASATAEPRGEATPRTDRP